MRQLAFLVQHLGLGEEATCLFEQTLPHCSTAALATPFNKLWVFVTTVDTLRQSAGHGRASFVGQHDIRYDGRNAFFEAATGAVVPALAGIPAEFCRPWVHVARLALWHGRLARPDSGDA